MSQLERLRARLKQSRTVTLTHPLDESVTMVHRTPTPEERDRVRADRPDTTEGLVESFAGVLADTLMEVREGDTPIADTYGMDLCAALGIEWVQGESTAAGTVRAFYGEELYNALIDHGVKVMALAAGGPADPLD